jgi:hypothetical protein
MKIKMLLFSALFLPFYGFTQNLPECDSVFIDCCSFNTVTSNTVTIEVSNYSSNIFSYPGFILFTTNMDTIAIETVNYFGIGWNQIHSLNIIHPFDLPFEGILELHTGFYENQVCTFPVSIADTILTSIYHIGFRNIEVFPNPAKDKLIIKHHNPNKINTIYINDLKGRIMIEIEEPASTTINLNELNPGFYFITIKKNNGSIFHSKFIKK